MGALPVLLDLGVRAVCSLENMCSLEQVRFSFIFSLNRRPGYTLNLNLTTSCSRSSFTLAAN